jgi:hypothetical protein
MDLTQKQACLENSSPVERLQLVRELLRNSKN